MQRTITVRLTVDERRALKLVREFADKQRRFRESRDGAIRDAVTMGLPVRLVGDAAGLSGAQVSRMTSR